ncbi:hypothetical protein ACTNDZ_13615 [Selenomonas montiformis]|uniref:hypothetical protein n=1 Tax=Selenomonas montiformis TaxID=2652285 RepID=UPI003F8A6EE6
MDKKKAEKLAEEVFLIGQLSAVYDRLAKGEKDERKASAYRRGHDAAEKFRQFLLTFIAEGTEAPERDAKFALICWMEDHQEQEKQS